MVASWIIGYGIVLVLLLLAVTECSNARAQRIETPWVTADTGSDWLDLLFVVVVLCVLFGLWAAARVFFKKGD